MGLCCNKTKGTLVHERGLGKYIPCTAPCAKLPCYSCPPDSFYPFRFALVPLPLPTGYSLKLPTGHWATH